MEIIDELIAQGLKVDTVITDLLCETTACLWNCISQFDEVWIRITLGRKDKSPTVLF